MASVNEINIPQSSLESATFAGERNLGTPYGASRGSADERRVRRFWAILFGLLFMVTVAVHMANTAMPPPIVPQERVAVRTVPKWGGEDRCRGQLG
jgi:hypothetical protein